MDYTDRVRHMFDQLDPDDRAAVFDVFADDIARGWIPKPEDVEAVIERVTAK